MAAESIIGAVERLREIPGAVASVSAPSPRRWFVELASHESACECAEALRAIPGVRLMAITCIDDPANRELLYHYSAGGDVVTLRATLWKPDATTKSIASIDPAAELMEREITELFGVAFENNPRTINMILPDGDASAPLSRRQGSIEVRIDRNLASIVETGATTAQSRRVVKAREGLGMPPNPPLCGPTCGGKCPTADLANASGAAARHTGLQRNKDGEV